jgi:mannose/fructose/N-acetylgalactosamine-specific phosphotransferase system component IID
MSIADQFRIFIRSFAIQGAWNFPRMQGLGFFYILAPWLRKVSGKHFQKACRRHLDYFNTHPFMVSYIAGVVARLEEEGNSEESVRARDSLMGPLGAVGDGFFWAKVRPTVILLALIISFRWLWAAAPLLLLVFNAIQIPERWSGVKKGYCQADTPFEGFSGKENRIISRFSSLLIATACGFILGIAAFRTNAPVSVFLLFGLGLLLFRMKLKTQAVIGYLVAAGLLLGVLGIQMEIPWRL